MPPDVATRVWARLEGYGQVGVFGVIAVATRVWARLEGLTRIIHTCCSE